MAGLQCAKLINFMEIKLLAIGKTTQSFVRAGIDIYLKRLARYVQYGIDEIPDPKSAKRLPEAAQKEKEGELILAALQPSDLVVLLDEGGKQYTSVAFAEAMQRMMNTGRKRIVFVVGGPYGFSAKVYARADAKVSLSAMTFTHEMVRLFFTEQIYRAMTILKGEPYHHE